MDLLTGGTAEFIDSLHENDAIFHAFSKYKAQSGLYAHDPLLFEKTMTNSTAIPSGYQLTSRNANGNGNGKSLASLDQKLTLLYQQQKQSQQQSHQNSHKRHKNSSHKNKNSSHQNSLRRKTQKNQKKNITPQVLTLNG